MCPYRMNPFTGELDYYETPAESPSFTGKVTAPLLKVTTGAGQGKILVSDADGDLFYLTQNNGINGIGTPGEVGFGVGICPEADLPTGMMAMDGCYQLGHQNYGNYQFADGSVMVWIPKFYYRMHTWGPAITAATNANPCKITATGHGLVNGDKIFIANVSGMTQINNLFFTVTRVDDNEFTIGVDSSAYGVWSSGGNFTKGFGASYEFNKTLITNAMNSIAIRGAETFANEAAANAAGYALHRAFIDGGVEQPGFFVDKYKCSKQAWGTGYVASSIANGLPLSSNNAHNPFSGLTGGVDACYSAIDLAHRRDGVNGAVNASSIFFCCSRFIHAALAMLSLAHGQYLQNDTSCAWYHATNNFPKGCNNNALKDVDDTAVTYASDGYSNCGRTGSGVAFAKTTHNGQACGVADLNGLVYEISIGATCIAAPKSITGATQANPCVITSVGHGYSNGDVIMIESVVGMTQLNGRLYTVANKTDDTFELSGVDSSGYTAYASAGTLTKGAFYAAKPSVAMKSFTHGNTGATDHWGVTGVAAMMDAFTPPFKTAAGEVTGAFAERMGSGANQVLSEALSGAGWLLSGMGFPKDSNGIDLTGTNLFGKDFFYQYIRNELCLVACAAWDGGTGAGVWGSYWGSHRSTSSNGVGLRAACYPV